MILETFAEYTARTKSARQMAAKPEPEAEAAEPEAKPAKKSTARKAKSES